MNLSHRMGRSHPARLLLAGTLLILSFGLAGAPALAENDGEGYGRRANPERREASQRQWAEAMAKLSPQQRQQYFAVRRQLEQQQAAQRLDQLQQAERCLVPASDVAAIERCQRSLKQQAMEARRLRMRELAELQERFGLPGWSKRPQQKQGA